MSHAGLKQWSNFIGKEEIIQIYITILKTVENVRKNTTVGSPAFPREAVMIGCSEEGVGGGKEA